MFFDRFSGNIFGIEILVLIQTLQMRFILFIFIIGLTACNSNKRLSKGDQKNLTTIFEQDPEASASYEQTIAYYQSLADASPIIQMNPYGETDCGKPLHEVVIDKDGDFTPVGSRSKGKAILFVNNGIHPGEPCGIDASMMLARNIASDKKMNKLLDQTTIVIIPIYNIGGSLNRGPSSRANQVGPKEYGFRGNAQNLDLNRDFIKGDSYNSRSFQALYTKWSPDIFIDNHTSNGADYQYVLTLIASQKDKMTPAISQYMTDQMLPDLYPAMEKSGYEMTPYVYTGGGIPDKGIYGFMDYPRYSSGYATLHNSIGFISEAHMLKTYEQRVQSIYHFMHNVLKHISINKEAILTARAKAIQYSTNQKDFDLNWTIDRTSSEKITFKGFEAKYKQSEVTNGSRLWYDRNAPFEKEIQLYNTYKPSLTVTKPSAYIIPQAYRDIVNRMKTNGVEVEVLSVEQTYDAEMYYIEDYETSSSPYEGHYLHSKVSVRTENQKRTYAPGDFIIRTNQKMNRYIVETLEPQAPDSWFAWNYFDGILMQKEYYSSYVFEDTAAKLLKEDSDLKQRFEQKKNEDPDFESNDRAQLDFIYKNSPYYEPTYKLYPVARVNKI